MSKRYKYKIEIGKQSKSFKTMWAMIQIMEYNEMCYNFQRDCNAKLGECKLHIYKSSNSIMGTPICLFLLFIF